jgi:hypothetical protein
MINRWTGLPRQLSRDRSLDQDWQVDSIKPIGIHQIGFVAEEIAAILPPSGCGPHRRSGKPLGISAV